MHHLMRLTVGLFVLVMALAASSAPAYAQSGPLFFYNALDRTPADGHIDPALGIVRDHTDGAGGPWTLIAGPR
jgi:hypothetical protein